MGDLKVAIMLGSLRLEPYQGMKKAADLGVTGLHISVDGGMFAPENLDAGARKELVRHLSTLGLEISAISCWGGQVDLTEADQHERNLPWAFRVLDLAAIGVPSPQPNQLVPYDAHPAGAYYATVAEALRAADPLGQHHVTDETL